MFLRSQAGERRSSAGYEAAAAFRLLQCELFEALRSGVRLPVCCRWKPVRWRPHRLHEHRCGSVQDDGGPGGHQDGAVRLQVAQR